MRGYFSPVRIILMSLIAFVLTANISLFILTQNGYVGNDFTYHTNFLNSETLSFAHYRYRGFKEFFEFMRTFPGLNLSLSSINEVASIFSGQLNYLPENLAVLDWLIKLVQIIFLPVKLIGTLVVDIVNIFLWLIIYFIPNWFGGQPLAM